MICHKIAGPIQFYQRTEPTEPISTITSVAKKLIM